ncbi:MAG: CheR family methyltransferase [Sulfitobacter sp.]
MENDPIDRDTFRTIAGLAYRECGLTLVKEKVPMMQSRLRHRLEALGLTDFRQYAALLESGSGLAERRQLISALTTNVSHFFREAHHFDAVCASVSARLPDLRAGAALRIWSAGCSNGQEPLSVAITLLEQLPEVAHLDLRILATDIDPVVIAFAKAGRYPQRLMQGLPAAIRARYFTEHPGRSAEAEFSVRPDLRSMIHYKELNLLANWPMKSLFDAVLCRNTVIYFDSETQRVLWPRFRQSLKQDGVLFLGHSERITTPQVHGFVAAGATTYRPLSA